MRTVRVTRYITPLREGGSMPAVVEAQDDGMYVLKFRGAGQGPRALVAELVAGQMARLLGLPMPEIVLAEVDVALADTEPDPEIQELIRASGGTNLAIDYLPGAFAFDPAAHASVVAAELASRIVWFDAFVTNLDRTRRNTNLLVWHRRLHLIDHGAALYFHHGTAPFVAKAQDQFALVAQHVLLPAASQLRAVDDDMAAALSPERIDALLAQVPASWLLGGTDHHEAGHDGEAHLSASAAAVRADYAAYFAARLAALRAFVQEAIEAHERVL